MLPCSILIEPIDSIRTPDNRGDCDLGGWSLIMMGRRHCDCITSRMSSVVSRDTCTSRLCYLISRLIQNTNAAGGLELVHWYIGTWAKGQGSSSSSRSCSGEKDGRRNDSILQHVDPEKLTIRDSVFSTSPPKQSHSQRPHRIMYQLLEGLMSACRHSSLSNECVLDDVSSVKALQVLERNGSTCGVLTTMISMFDSATLE